MSTRQERPRPALCVRDGRGHGGGYVKQQFIDMLRGQNWSGVWFGAGDFTSFRRRRDKTRSHVYPLPVPRPPGPLPAHIALETTSVLTPGMTKRILGPANPCQSIWCSGVRVVNIRFK